MRLIDADRLMDRLRGNVLVDVTPALEDEVAEQPTVHQWIPVTERLPEDDTDMIVCKTDGIIDLAFGDNNYWRSMTMDFAIDVCAWMPLPKPYNPQN